jgi:hypothetical protein
MAKLTLTDIAAGYALIATINANNAAIETALENTLSRDGTAPNTMSADLDMNSQQITNLIDPTSDAHAARKKYVDDQVTAVSTASGSFSEALAYSFTNQIKFLGDDLGIRIGNAADTNYIDIMWDSINSETQIIGDTDGDVLKFENLNVRIGTGRQFRVWDSDENSYFQIQHDGTDVLFNGSVTTDLTLSGFTAINLGSADLEDYGTAAGLVIRGSFTGTGTGMTTSPTGTINYTIIDNVCTLSCDTSIQGTSNSTAYTITGLPAAVVPTGDKAPVTTILDNTTTELPCVMNVDNATSALVFRPWTGTTFLSTGFTASGTKGISGGWTISYPLI